SLALADVSSLVKARESSSGRLTIPRGRGIPCKASPFTSQGVRLMTHIDRRAFLGTGVSALALSPLALAAADEKKDDFGGFKLGAQSYTFREFNLEQALSRMQKLGLKYGEFYSKHCPLTDKPKALEAFLSTCKEFGVTPLAWGVQRFTKDHDANKR